MSKIFTGFSMNDIYPNSGKSQTETTTGETIPEDEERDFYTENTVKNAEGKTTLVNKNMIIGVLVLGVAMVLILNHIE